jgi:hypothetical protein
MISEPPPQNPWILWDSVISNPQDCQWGACLTVPAKFVTVLNCKHGADLGDSDSDSDCGAGEERVEFADHIALSRPETPPPATPPCDPEIFFFDDGEEYREFAGVLEELPTDTDESLSCAEIPRDHCDLSDEDDLPPFDEWYTSIQSRTQGLFDS